MFGVVRSLKNSRPFIGALRSNNSSWSETPFIISLAVGGISLQAYASYMLITTGKLSNIINYGVKEMS